MMNLFKQLIFVLLCVFSSLAQAAWSVRYQHTDVLGSVIAESNAQGTITQRFGYKPFGEGSPTQKTGVGYTGHLEDTDLGLTYMQQRYYDPVIGRFYSNDPVDMLGHMQRGNPTMGFNRYAYANNNPYKYIDPDGRAVVYYGLTIGGSAGASGSGAKGRFVEVTSSGIRGGTYESGEIGASTSPPSVDGGLEIGAMTGKYESALKGGYMLAGAEGVAAVGGSIAGVTTLSASPDVGLQVSLMLGTPQLGAYQHTGYGDATETFSFTVDDVSKAMDTISNGLSEIKESFEKVLE